MPTQAPRLHARVVALHRDLGTCARIARRTQDVDQALANLLGNPELEQLDQDLGAVRDRKNVAPGGCIGRPLGRSL